MRGRGGRQATSGRQLHYFPETVRLGRRVAALAGVPATAVALHRFPDGESLVRLHWKGEQEAVVVRSLDDPNAKLVEVLLAADAARRAGARRVTLLAPYLPYMRQDRVFSPGEPVSQQVIGRMLGAAFDRVLTVEAHLHRINRLAQVVPGAARSISAAPAVAAWIARGRGTLVVGPDGE